MFNSHANPLFIQNRLLTRSLRDFFRRFIINCFQKYNLFPSRIASMPISRDKFRPISGSETKKIHDELTRLLHQEY